MAGVTAIQVTATLQFDDGYLVTVATPVLKKDIRDGDYFDDETTQEIMVSAGNALAGMLEQQTVNGLHKMAQIQITSDPNKRKPKHGDDFSAN